MSSEPPVYKVINCIDRNIALYDANHLLIEVFAAAHAGCTIRFMTETIGYYQASTGKRLHFSIENKTKLNIVPPKTPGIVYMVDRNIASHFRYIMERRDFVYPSDPIIDPKNKAIIGYKKLVCINDFETV